IPKCRKLYFHNENLVSDIHRGGKTAMVYRYSDGKLEFKKDIWVGNGRHFWALPDGKMAILIYGTEYVQNDQKQDNFPFLKERKLEKNYIASLRDFPTNIFYSGCCVHRAIKFLIFSEKLDKSKMSSESGERIVDGIDCVYFINGENSFYFQTYQIGGIKIETKTGKLLDIYNDLSKKSPSKKEIADRMRENYESCTISSVDRFIMAPTLHKSLYKNGTRIVTTDISVFDNTTTYKVAAGECLFGKADILITGKNEKNPTSLYDEELKKLIKPHCKKAPLVFVNKYRIQNRPGGGFVVNFNIGVKPLDRRYLAKAGSYYREYSAEGKPIGPVIKTQSEVEILSENHYRVTEGCHYEYRHRPVTK
ncbi:hypothetical protein KKD49_12955, partial [Myxococcota bacterium]|nr:hypothetical protein [Myxococcota bacterium]